MSPLTREHILTALQQAIEPLPYAHAMWQGGAAAFNRVDEWSDIDLQIDVDDERVAEACAVVEATLAERAPVALKFELPQPTWHGHYQAFYRFRDASEFLVLDLAVIKHSHPNKFLEREIHGEALVLFDKSGVVQAPPLDRAAWAAKLQERLATLRVTFELFQSLTTKELHRHNLMEAVAFYHGYSLRPLIELLRMRHSPARYNFHTRYVYYDLPADLVRTLEPMFFPRDAEDLRAKREQAARMFAEALAQINPATLGLP
jgi:hypothetical protein